MWRYYAEYKNKYTNTQYSYLTNVCLLNFHIVFFTLGSAEPREHGGTLDHTPLFIFKNISDS